MSRRRVLMVGPSPRSAGGMASVAACFLRHWDHQRYEVRFVTSWTSDDKSVVARGWRSLLGWWEFFWALLTWRPDLVHIHFAYRGSFWRKAVVAWLARALPKARVIMHCHSGAFPEFYDAQPLLIQGMIRRVLRGCDLLLVVANSWGLYFTTLCPDLRIRVLHNPVECPTEPVGNGKRRPVFLSLGTLGHSKGTYDILDAVPQVIDAVPSAEFWLGGNGEVDAVRSILARAPWGDRVRLLGWVGGAEKEAALTTASALLLPSYAEGFPIAVLEAMAHGAVAITTPVGGIPEAIHDGETGVMVRPGDVNGLAAACIELTRDPDRRNRLAGNARKYVQDHFAVAGVMPKLYGFYDDLLDGVPLPSAEKIFS